MNAETSQSTIQVQPCKLVSEVTNLRITVDTDDPLYRKFMEYNKQYVVKDKSGNILTKKPDGSNGWLPIEEALRNEQHAIMQFGAEDPNAAQNACDEMNAKAGPDDRYAVARIEFRIDVVDPELRSDDRDPYVIELTYDKSSDPELVSVANKFDNMYVICCGTRLSNDPLVMSPVRSWLLVATRTLYSAPHRLSEALASCVTSNEIEPFYFRTIEDARELCNKIRRSKDDTVFCVAKIKVISKCAEKGDTVPQDPPTESSLENTELSSVVENTGDIPVVILRTSALNSKALRYAEYLSGMYVICRGNKGDLDPEVYCYEDRESASHTFDKLSKAVMRSQSLPVVTNLTYQEAVHMYSTLVTRAKEAGDHQVENNLYIATVAVE